LVDCKSFYASCHAVFEPVYERVPVVVLSNNDGCIVALNDKAKALGFSRGGIHFKQERALKKLGVKVFSSNYTLYGDLSNRVFDTLRSFTPEVEPYSIDEAFMHLSGYEAVDLNTLGREVVDRVRDWTRLPVRIAISTNKTLAKSAGYYAKRAKSARGVFVLMTPHKIDLALKHLPIDQVWGIGWRTAAKLRAAGITTAAQYRDADSKWVQHKFTVVGWRTQQELRGRAWLPFERAEAQRKHITCTRGFGTMISSKHLLREAIANFTARAALKLRKRALCARAMTVLIRTNRFDAHSEQYRNSHTIDLPVASDSTPELIEYALQGLDRIYKKNYRYKRGGVILSGLVPVNTVQLGLFDQRNRNAEGALMKAVDQLNHHHGQNTLWFGAQGHPHLPADWHLRYKFPSPHFTTDWSELPMVRG